MFLDISGTSTVATCIHPRGPEQTTVVTEYLFHPDAMDEPGFDPAEIIEFNEAREPVRTTQCERVQRGVRSRAFTNGVYPKKDELPLAFKLRYLAARDNVSS